MTTDASIGPNRSPWVSPIRWPPATTTVAPRQLQPAEPVVVAPHRHHRRHLLQLLQHPGDAEVAGVEDQVAALQRLQHRRGERVQVLADVGVGDDADAPQQR